MQEEIWKKIEGYPSYSVSNIGRVRNDTRDKLLKLVRNRCGYIVARLNIEGVQKTHTIHRLVAMAYIPNPLNKPEVNHINEDKTDNRVSNLEWVTRSENILHGTRSLRVSQAMTNHPNISKHILQFNQRGELLAEYPSSMEASRITETSWRHISACCHGKRKTAGGYLWKYKEDMELGPPESIIPPLTIISKYSRDGQLLWIYSSIYEAAEDVGTTATHISGCVLGKRKSAGGFIWKRNTVQTL